MKIAMFGHKRIPSREGGVEIVVEELASRMVKTGNEVTCFNRNGKGCVSQKYGKRYNFNGIEVKTVPTIDKKGMAAVTAAFFSSVMAAFGKYDIVHIHDAFILKFIFKTIRKYKNIKIIIHSHATKWSDKKINSLRNWLLCLRNYKYADYLFACSEAAGRFMFKDRDFYILNNAIDVCKFSYNADKRRQIRNKLKIDNKTVIGHVGNFNKQKNHEFIINVFEKVMFEKSDAILLLIGEGTLKSNIEKIVQEKKLNSNVLFVGKKENVQDYYSAMDVFILPSLYEGLPMVGVEAQCSGLPALFSANITREVELTNCKFLDLKQGSEGWKNEILHTKLVPEEIRKKAANLVTKKNFDIKNESNKLMEVYERIVNS